MIVPDRRAASILAEHLQRGEKLLWFGRAAPRRMEQHVARLATVGIVSGAAGVVAFLFHAWSTAGLDPRAASALDAFIASSRFHLLASALLTVGMCAGAAFAWAKWVAGRTCYAVSTERLIFIQGGAVGSIWMGRYELMDVELVEYPDGTGDLVFRRNRTAPLGRTWARPSSQRRDLVQDIAASLSGQAEEEAEAFVGIRDARAVRELIVNAFQKRWDTGSGGPR